MTGTSFINRPQTEVFGEAVGITFIVDCLKEDNRDLVTSFCLYQVRHYSHHLPVTEGRFLEHSGGGELGPRYLVAPFWRPEPLAGCIWALAKLRRPWYAARYLQNYWRAFRTWNAGGCSGFWQLRPYVQPDVGKSSSWRGLSRVCPLTHSDTSSS